SINQPSPRNLHGRFDSRHRSVLSPKCFSRCSIAATAQCTFQWRGHVLHADPFLRSTKVLHTCEQIRCRHSAFGQTRTVGASTNRRGTRLDYLTTGKFAEPVRPGAYLSPTSSAYSGTAEYRTCDRRPRLGDLNGGAHLAQ